MSKKFNEKQQRSIIVAIKNVYHNALVNCWSHEEILEQLQNRVYSYPYYQEAPRYSLEYLRGYADAIADSYWNNLEWRSFLDGQLMKGDEIPQGRWIDVKPGCFVYKKDPTRRFTEPREELAISEIAHNNR